MSTPRWDDLRIFLAVARTESLTAAGRALHLDPATVGRRMQRLEDDLATVLFVRSPQGYLLTETGRELADRAARVEAAVTGAFGDIQDRGQGLSGTIRIGAPDGCANYVLPQVMARIVARNPGLDVQIVALPRVFNLSRREADMAIAVSPPQAGRLVARKITDYHLHLAAAQTYLDRHGPIARLDALRHHPIIGYVPDMIFDKELDYLDEAWPGLHPAFASNSVSVQIMWTRRGAGISIMHDFALPFAPELVRVLPEAFSLTRSFYLIRHADDLRSARQNELAAAVADGVRAEIAALEAAVLTGTAAALPDAPEAAPAAIAPRRNRRSPDSGA